MREDGEDMMDGDGGSESGEGWGVRGGRRDWGMGELVVRGRVVGIG